MHILHSELIKCKEIDYIAYFVFRKPTFAVVSLMLVSYAHHSLSDSDEPRKHINISIYKGIQNSAISSTAANRIVARLCT